MLCRRVITVIISRLLHFQVMTLILVICTTALHLVLLSHKAHMSFRHAIATSQGVGSAIAFCLSIILIWPVSALLSYHLRVSRSQCAPASSNEVTDSVDRTAAPAQRYHDRTGTCCVRSPMCPRACAVIVRGPCRRPAISDIALTDRQTDCTRAGGRTGRRVSCIARTPADGEPLVIFLLMWLLHDTTACVRLSVYLLANGM